MALAEEQESLLSTVAFTTDFNSTPLYIARVGGPKPTAELIFFYFLPGHI